MAPGPGQAAESRRAERAPDGSAAADAQAQELAFELDRRLGWLFHDVHVALGRAFDARVADLGLTRAQFRVLTHVLREPGMTQTGLAERVEIEKAPLGRTVDKLEEAGWLERRADPMDRRAKRIYPTDKLAPHVTELRKVVRQVFAQALDGLSMAEIDQLIATLTRIKTNLNPHHPAPEAAGASGDRP